MWWIILVMAVLGITYGCYWITFYNPESRHHEAVMTKRGRYAREEDALSKELEANAYEQVNIRSRDGLRLAGRYYHLKDGAPLHIQFHGYRGSAPRDLGAVNHVARSLGYNTLVVDQRAHGLSQGNTMTFGIKERWDCLAWAQYAAERFGVNTPIFLYGISMGGASVLMAADLPLPASVVGIIADCPYSSPVGIIRKICRDVHIPGWIAVPLETVAAGIWGRFWLLQSGAESAVRNANVPILLIHGKEDKYILPEMSREIQDHCTSRCYLELFPGATHAGSCLTDTARYQRILKKFVESCLMK